MPHTIDYSMLAGLFGGRFNYLPIICPDVRKMTIVVRCRIFDVWTGE